jgi:hypothetical protein
VGFDNVSLAGSLPRQTALRPRGLSKLNQFRKQQLKEKPKSGKYPLVRKGPDRTASRYEGAQAKNKALVKNGVPQGLQLDPHLPPAACETNFTWRDTSAIEVFDWANIPLQFLLHSIFNLNLSRAITLQLPKLFALNW